MYIQTEFQLNKANTSDKENSFLYLDITVVGSDVHTSVYDKRDDLRFPIVNFPWLSGDFPRLPSYGFYISQFVRFARCCTGVWISIKKISNYFLTPDTGLQISQASKIRKTFGKFFRPYSELLTKFGEISFQEYVFGGISHTVLYGDLFYKLRRVKCEANFVSSGSKNSQTPSTSKVWPSDHRNDDRSCTWSFYSLVQIFPKALHCDKQGGGDYMTGFVQKSSEETRPWSSPPLIVSRDSFSPSDGRSIAYSGRCLHIFLIYCFYHLTCLWNNFYGLSALVGCWSSVFIRRIIYNMLMCVLLNTQLLWLVGNMGSRKLV